MTSPGSGNNLDAHENVIFLKSITAYSNGGFLLVSVSTAVGSSEFIPSGIGSSEVSISMTLSEEGSDLITMSTGFSGIEGYSVLMKMSTRESESEIGSVLIPI
ncbi:hypothetical protein AVEN_160540-1 [Araneus ventricosus]|uniref:Uncharacterized protein n=1 Tax=Araneus ventricosus TaxID=182803 RepID=A0A4Y2PCE0_ARAVE|nr:hypothetical protein AVEN_160540-1 [Araneus ventricosus]